MNEMKQKGEKRERERERRKTYYSLGVKVEILCL